MELTAGNDLFAFFLLNVSRISLLAYSPLAMGILSGKYFAEDGGPSNARLNLFKGQTGCSFIGIFN